MRLITAYDVAEAIVENWVFRYGPPWTLMSYNGWHFVPHFFQLVYELTQITNSFRTMYHPQRNGQFKQSNCSLSAMLRSYVQ